MGCAVITLSADGFIAGGAAIVEVIMTPGGGFTLAKKAAGTADIAMGNG